MSAWFLVPCLAALRDEINAFASNRDHASDGTIGDAAHQAEKSDHNPDAAGRVHAIDVDSSGPWPIDWSAERLTQLLLDRQRSGEDDRLQYLIYNRRIWSRSWGWAVRPYNGPSAHLEHIHLSARHDATRDHVQPWGILEEIDMMTPEQVQQAVQDGMTALLFDGFHAATNDPAYKAASPDRQKAMRNIRDTMRGIVGGPVDPAAVAAQVVNQLPTGGQATEADIEQALRTVLRTGVGTA